MRLIQDHKVPLLALKQARILQHDGVAGDADVEGIRFGPPLALDFAFIGAAKVRHNLKPGRPPFEFHLPVDHDARRHHHQVRTPLPTLARVPRQESNGLQGLAQPHFVGQNAVEAALTKRDEPAETLLLVPSHVRANHEGNVSKDHLGIRGRIRRRRMIHFFLRHVVGGETGFFRGWGSWFPLSFIIALTRFVLVLVLALVFVCVCVCFRRGRGVVKSTQYLFDRHVRLVLQTLDLSLAFPPQGLESRQGLLLLKRLLVVDPILPFCRLPVVVAWGVRRVGVQPVTHGISLVPAPGGS